jgi:hypothetical protein
MSLRKKAEGEKLSVGDVVQLGNAGACLWKVEYVHGDGNLTLATRTAKRNYVHPSSIRFVLDKTEDK